MMQSTHRPRLILITTSCEALHTFFLAQCRFLREEGFDVFAICSPGPQLESFEAESGCKVYRVPMSRSINPLADLRALAQILSLLRQLRPAIVHTHTPKAGLLGMLAARVLGLPIRLHTFHGLRSETLNGFHRTVVLSMERLTARLATSCLAVSRSLRNVLVDRDVCRPGTVSVLGYGGCAGVDLRLFRRERYVREVRTFLEHKGAPSDSLIVSYVGRIAKDKGIEVLADAWRHVSNQFPDAHLCISGPLDQTDPVDAATLLSLQSDARVHLDLSFVADVPLLLASTDIFVSPSFREGLGVTVLEASAMEVPVILSRVTGLVDTALDGITGVFVPARDANALAEAICTLLKSRSCAVRLGAAGRHFVEQRFDREQIFHHLVRRYRLELLPMRAPRTQADTAISRGKRVFDVTLSLLLLALTAPLLLAAILIVLVSMGRPIFFQQERGGFRGKTFKVVKLRTMMSAPAGTGAGSDAARLTATGRLLRKLSIDELPQLWNVLRGEMSLVGPRPLLVSYLERYDMEQARRHDVLPGITGWAQIHGRNALSWKSKFQHDVWYVDHHSFTLDLKILWMTLLHVVMPRGISAPGSATTTEFLGRENRTASQ